MGFTPLEGLMMGTRCGDIDPAIVPYLMRREGLDDKGIDNFLNKKCGLAGVSGRSADTRELRKHMDDANSELAVRMFCYRVRKYIGAYLAVLGGAEAIVFGGGIGQDAPEIREQICEGLEGLGIVLDRDVNRKVIDCEGVISAPESKVTLWVIPSREAVLAAYDAAQIPGAQKRPAPVQMVNF